MLSTRLTALPILLALVHPAFAQAPGQMPGTLPPAPAVVAPPPPVAPAAVPSAVSPLPRTSMGVPRNINSGPVIGGSGGTVRSIYRGSDGYRGPKKKHPKGRRRPRVSAY